MNDVLVFVDDNCRSCEKVLGMARSLEDASMNLRVVHRWKEPALAVQYNVQIVPAVFIDGKLCFYGDFTREEFQRVLKKLNHPVRRVYDLVGGQQSTKGGIRNEET